jgi:hypothetical protein
MAYRPAWQAFENKYLTNLITDNIVTYGTAKLQLQILSNDMAPKQFKKYCKLLSNIYNFISELSPRERFHYSIRFNGSKYYVYSTTMLKVYQELVFRKPGLSRSHSE